MRRLLPLVLIACSAPDPGDVRIIGHGGAGSESEHPMNSRTAMISGLEQGASGIEMDVQLTADDVLVAYHPPDLAELTACSGKVNAHTWDALRSCPNDRASGPHPIVRLDSVLTEAFQRFPNADFTLDCKLFAEGDWWPYLEAFSDAVVRSEARSGSKGRLLVECQVVDFLMLVKRKGPDIPVFLYATSAEAGIDTAAARGLDGITIDNALITANQVARARKLGLQVTLFGVDGAVGHRDAIAKHPDRLQTDAPGAFAR